MSDETNPDAVEFTDLPADDEINVESARGFSDAVVHGTDWTTGTIVDQLRRGNILLKPRFQRRDAWRVQHKSRFIESLMLGLPIPPIVLAEQKEQRGKFIVLDGKQRLLSLLQFWGLGDGANNAYALSGLQVLKDLNRKTFEDLEREPRFENYLNALLNQPIRTAVIKNWPDTNFLHLVFLRLNTGSVKLSPQELRQAIVPGKFTDWVDEAALKNQTLQHLLGITEPDFRMRDVELLARFFSFRFFIADYRGRMKEFLDKSFETLNANWGAYLEKCEDGLSQFEKGVRSLEQVFGASLARKPGGKLFNRAIFDFLIFYAQHEVVRIAQEQHVQALKREYELLFQSQEFTAAVERDTAGIPNTVRRLASWCEVLNRICGLALPVPRLVNVDGDHRINCIDF